MKCRRALAVLVILLAVLPFLFPAPAYAYLDPGTGSYVLQLLLAALVGGLFAIRLFWGRIKAFFRRLLGKEIPEEQDEQ